ncbi:MAG TPA: lipopolysaccharide N-acetylglucosaminyl transferase [Burkholderiaceae bacterium]|nr:lipopolysaccharide N-acetylglucosaminyl transferase [Burkholderiaceae bacterium]
MKLWLGLAAELAALAIPAGGSRDAAVLLAFLALHGGATALLAPAVWATLPAGLRVPRGATLGTLAVLNLFVPTLLLWLRAALWIGARLSRRAPPRPIVTVESPEFTLTREREGSQVRAGQVRARLTSGEAPASARLAALLAIQDAPGRVTAEILRQLLADPFEDIRLLAYGMLDRKEKVVAQRILAERATLEAAGPGADPDLRYGVHKLLAELHWELVYQRLVHGELARYTAREAWRHAHEALALRADDAGLWYLLGRVGLDAAEPDAGRAALERAAELGYPRERVVPWLAEYAFRERRYEDVRDLFTSLPTAPESMRTAAAHQYWKY